MSESSRITSVLSTAACWMAASRAKENARADRLFFDPWALALAGETGRKWLESLVGSPYGTTPMVIRTRFFDDYLKNAVLKRNLRQVVLLAAGLDTRAFRLEWPEGVHLYELDQAEVLQEREQVFQSTGARSTCTRKTVSIDLKQRWEDTLIAAGFQADQPAVWLAEGFLFYLTPEQISSLLHSISRLSAVGSRLGFDIINRLTLTSPYTKTWINMQERLGSPWQGWLENPQSSLIPYGWRASLSQPGASDANYGRWTMPVIPLMAADLPHTWYVKATKVSKVS